MTSKEVKKEVTNTSREKILNQISEIGHTLFGIEPIIKIYCLSKASDLTIMLLGAHATAKSSLARMWSLTTGLNYRVVTSSEVDESLIAYIDPAIFREKNIVQMRRGELMEKDHIIVDEFFLWLNKYRAKLHQLLEERTYAGLDVLTKTYTFLCLDTETEALTSNGWKRYNEISPSDKVLSLNPETDMLEWSPVLARWEYDYDGPMVSIQDRDFSSLTTLNHRFLVKDKRRTALQWRLASDLKRQRDLIPQARNVSLPEKQEIISDDQVRLMAWLKTEGRLEPGNTLLIYQSEGPHVAEIEALLSSMELAYVHSSRIRDSKKREHQWTIYAKSGKAIKEIVKDKVIRISDLELMTPRQLEIFYNILIKGDGWRAEKMRGWEMFCSKNKESIDTFQFLATLLGKRCVVKNRIAPIGNGPRKGQLYSMWYAYIPQIKKDHLIKRSEIVPYKGKIWCLSTQLGNFLIRRNGKVHITGNSNPLSDYYAGQIEEKNLACYSEDTEILTGRGWKKYTEILAREKVFTLNPKSQVIQLEQIKKKVVYPYEGKMYLLDSQQINQLVTPNHRVYIAKQEQGKWHWQVREAREIYGQKFRLLKTGKWRGTSKVSKDYMALIGWYLAEGSPKTHQPTGHYGIDLVICVPRQIDEVMTLAKKLGYNPHLQRDGHIVIWNKELWKVCKPLGHANEKFIPEELKAESKENLQSLLFSYLKGDGWKQGNQWLAKTVSKRLADDIQEIALKSGFSANLVNIGKTEGFSKKLGRLIKSRYDCWQISLITKRCWPLFLGRENKNRKRTIEEWKDYSGKVWCVSTNNGILYVRRNGKANWSGNTIDRLDLFVPVNQPKIVPSESMMRKFSEFGRSERTLKKVISWEDYLQAKEEISQVEVPSRIVIWLSLFAHSMAACKHTEDKFSMSIPKLKKLCAGCNENNHICARVALSKPRFLRATIILAKGLAWLDGHKTISFKDINEAVIYTLPHRLSWIQEELSYAESLEQVPELVQQFNDEMLAWKNRGIFSELSTVIEASKKKPPVFDDKTSSSLSADVSEIHLLKEFVAETVQSVKEGICQYYSKEGEAAKFDSLGKLEGFVEHSNLNPYEKDELVFSIARKQKELCMQFPYASEKVEELIKAVISLHELSNVEIDPKEIFLKKFSEAILFSSELMKIREESGEVQIIFKDSRTKKMFLDLWEEKA